MNHLNEQCKYEYKINLGFCFITQSISKLTRYIIAQTGYVEYLSNLKKTHEFNIIKKGYYNESTGDTRQVFCPKF